MRRIEKSLVHALGLTERCAALRADAGAGEPICAKLDCFGRTGKISAGLGHATARIFDKRTHAEIRAVIGRLMLIAEFAVAVVYDDENLRLYRLCCLDGLSDFLGRQRFAYRIAFGALDKYHFHGRLTLQIAAHLIDVDISVRRHFLCRILHAEIGKRAVSGLAAQPDDLFQRVIRLAGD